MLTNFNGKTITYDEIGNPIKYLGDTLTWTEGRRLSSLSRPYPGKPEYQTIYTYKYNAAGQRTSKTKTYSTTGESITTEFIYEGDLLVGQKTSDGKGDMTFLHDDTGAYIGLIYEGAEYYYMKNVQGDIIGIVDAEGVIQAVYTYEPFGKLFSIETKSGFLRYDGDWSVGGMNPIRYRGYYYDYDTKLYYLNSRYYDPYVGRFLNADDTDTLLCSPYELTDKNLFAYCDNNPIMRVDYIGDFWMLIGGAIGALVGGAVSAVSQYVTTGKIDWRVVGVNAAAGAISGAIASTGVGLFASIGINAVLGGGTYVAEQVIKREKITVGGVVASTASGAISGIIGGKGTNAKGLSAAWGSAKKGISRELRRANVKYATKQIAKYTVKKVTIKRMAAISISRFVIGAIGGTYSRGKFGY